MKNKSQFGFTLIELMIVVAVVGILAALAYTSYSTAITKSGRSDAMIELNSVLQRMNRCFTTTNTYQPPAGRCGVVDELGVGIESKEGYYNITVINLTPTTFTLVATPIAGRRQVNDTRCTEFRITNSGLQTASMGGVDNTEECW